jgi:hypothetical protein
MAEGKVALEITYASYPDEKWPITVDLSAMGAIVRSFYAPVNILPRREHWDIWVHNKFYDAGVRV